METSVKRLTRRTRLMSLLIALLSLSQFASAAAGKISNDFTGGTGTDSTTVAGPAAGKVLALAVYPARASKEVQVSLPEKWKYKTGVIEILTTGGELVKMVRSGNARQTAVVDIKDLKKGTYLLRVRTETEMAQELFTKG